MITGVHTMFYSPQAEAVRAFIRDKLGFPYTDVHDGWLIFDLPEGEMGVHPADDSQPHARANTHDISFYCDDVQQTVADLKAKGVEFTTDIVDQGYGLVTSFKMPGDLVVNLYQPRYVKNTRPKAAKKNATAVTRAKASARKKTAKKMRAGAKKKVVKKKVMKKAGGRRR